MSQQRYALLSVSDKTGIVPLAECLVKHGYIILSTGGTAKFLREYEITVLDVSEFTGFPEMMDGRVKTLHPKVHGALLRLRGNADHDAQAETHGIQLIDFVVVNLYPFEKTVAKPETTLEEAIEQIDIGGPSMLRSAAKNYRSVTAVVDPGDYAEVRADLNESPSTPACTTLALRGRLASKVFVTTAKYDFAIATHLDPILNPAPESFQPPAEEKAGHLDLRSRPE